MELEEQVCGVELSKQLKALGVKQDSYFSWDIFEGNGEINYKLTPHSCPYKFYSAFTVAELLNKLKGSISYTKNNRTNTAWLNISKLGDNFEVVYIGLHQTNNAKLADALTEMLIYLIENKLMVI